ncbi:chromosome segregation protein SMC [Alteromonas sp. C1M14]|uniref:chromosome segregation protein SMC n=1 Tax=Alteromonas sp. C1M14 TaxID=2841567 RepID=UPI001C097972|nr:chromosome segregation protein SMC [Alteromonas sp. C1M14]MBU2976991.1 chromosome segregation protein SMC [Alteromonas sp. C1M14]
MRLKSIKLAGFKSFVDPTTIPFVGEMTAVVGPNGCGKSNVIDAVRWVLGESSAKNLRGDAMTDVIFNGSSARKPVGQCSVELIFDNTSGRIGGEFANYAELSVKRLVTRDAQSFYYLNGTKCRRRDVTDLFLGTGLGPRSYAIIEQGMISRLIESKPQELRVFIEEAAGISKYKERRRETENRIRHTQDNLERLDDVRGELGRQLEKLQRQAVAAQRYKELKARERQLKSELSVIRYLKHSGKITQLENDRAQIQHEIDELVSQQRGDEAGIEKYRSQGQSCKLLLEDLQQQLFSVSNQITRLEQDALHSQQREKQLTKELDDLSARKALLLTSLEEGNKALAGAQNKLATVEPQLAIQEAALEQAYEHNEHAENTLRAFTHQRREQERQYLGLKQQVQHLHSKIQSVTQMQLRTTERLSELRQEAGESHIETLKQQCTALLDEIAMAAEKVAITEDELALAEDAVVSLREKYNVADAGYSQKQRELQQAESKHAALMALQEDAETEAATLPEGVMAFWQAIKVKPGFEPLFEHLTYWLLNPVVAKEYSLETLVASREYLPTGRRILPMSDNKAPTEGSVAACLDGDFIPTFLNRILVAEDVKQAQQLLQRNPTCFAVITETGEWISEAGFIQGMATQNSDGAIARLAKIAQLDTHIGQLSDEVQRLREQREEASERVNQAKLRRDNARQQRMQVINNKDKLSHQHGLLQQQWDAAEARRRKLDSEIEKYQQQLADEDAQLSLTSAQLEEQEEALMYAEEAEQESASTRESLDANVKHSRHTIDQHKSRVHELQLTLQQQQSQLAMYQQQVTRNQEQLADYEQRISDLNKEKQTLSQPKALSEAQLQALLLEREALEEKRLTNQAKLTEIDALLSEAQKGQQGILGQIQQRQGKIDSLNIEIEGTKVRAASVLEQLTETGQTLKALLPTLEEGADEQRWQQTLEKTTAAISRLGAVNLAAVEEYDTQAERKAHLDTQFTDLTDALDTLQGAIRKIDKETRQRFANTFEKVNEGLKTLFPKVFGGGSAYLALTDDDLLETGVTIMARPPGKKNSTIHLLSGGEKALTALSLVFAIFRLNPAPFCLLDEVDAPLDDANVGRFCNLVSEMSDSVQFIYITHNKIAMEMATHLTGVTMAEPGVSRMVAVDVDEAMAFVEA